MSDIDPEELEEAIDRMARYFGQATGHGDLLVINAARAHLATLPRWKEIECEYFEVTDIYGNPHGVYPSLGAAESIARLIAGRVVVRLTGTAKVKVTR